MKEIRARSDDVLNEDRITIYEILDSAVSGIRLQVEFQRRANAALVACGLPFVRAIAVHNETGRDLKGLELTVDLSTEGGAAQRVVHREEKSLTAGNVARFAGREYFAEFDSPITACRDAASAVLTIAVRPVQAEDGDGKKWPTLTVAAEIAAADEFRNVPGLRHSIAAFVRPDSRAVTKLLQGAADFLCKKTGSGELDGYRGGFGRARLIAEAIYLAMRDEGVACADSLTPCDAATQKVRSGAAVLAGRSGAYLDLSVLYAACCEAAGLHALIVIAATRVFPAFIAISDLEYSLVLGGDNGFEYLEEMLVEAPHVIARLVESKAIVPVELGGVGQGKRALGFRAATKRAADYARSAVLDLKAAVLIPQCRKEHVLPLPEWPASEPPVAASEPPVAAAEPPVAAPEPPVSAAAPPVASSEPPVSAPEPP
ncbi:MAG: hypothetical protein LBT71_04675, partial [Azoarcus sp.]|nr:hypothetical protein [Azoarcus sp.]